ncbi:LacI family transcriptional regulator [Nocardioides thalensis]|uniref:LacI family transcriptional regulator n=1 Tax=Nocardioides thalensis TaxID=1914755 RepID=A0A853BWK2_9ACTN|nr:LacI family DNA-binding transcriptional regulator [Nocardioides thalensis]NYI99628.1 LacI family transcriptional regulator [Nocardioides thalensis]
MAASLGVDVSTVSRVLNGSRDEALRAASPETADRIRAHAALVGYRPDPHATGLRTQRSGLVAVIVPRLSDGVLALLVEGIESEARKAGLAVFAMSSHDDPEDQTERVATALGRRVDGLIVADARLDTPLPTSLLRGDTPFVLANRRLPDNSAVTGDDVLGGRLVAEHLVASGRSRLAVIGGPPYASTAVDRVSGFVASVRATGLDLPDERVVDSGFDIASGRDAMQTILQNDPDVDAVFAVDDYAAIGASSVARAHGRVIGKDLAVVGYNDTPVAAELEVALSSVAHPTFELGRAALLSLSAMMTGAPPRDETMQPTLIVRDSSR